jgi:putative ABC transport system permease protein
MFGRRSQDDFEDEIRAHLQMEIDRLIARGMSPQDAERAARRNFGNIAAAEDLFYDHQRFAWLVDLARDLRHAWRALLRTPAFLAACVVTLALAIGAVAGMFSVVRAVLLEPLAFPAPDRLVVLRGNAPGSDLPARYGLSNEFYLHYKERSKLLAGLFAFSGGTSTLRVGDRVERIEMAFPTNDMYATLGVRPQLGRLPVTADNDDAVVISDKLWDSWFGRDSSVIGKWFFVSDSLKQVIGIMPRGFHFPDDDVLLWVSGEITLNGLQPGSFGVPIVARMKPGVTDERLATELTQLAKELPARFGGTSTYTRIIGQHHTTVVPLADDMIGPTLRTSLLVLLGGVAVVLLIACANVANLFLVRAESRRRDLTVRRAIGASRGQLARFQMAEAAAVALVSGVLAIALAAVTLPMFLRAAPDGIPRLSEVRLDTPIVAATFGLVLIVALACGAAPALRASSPDLSGLREGGRNATGGRAWGRDLLVITQTALALVLLIGSALLVESFRRLRHVNPGYDIKDLYTFQYAPDQPGLRDGPSLGRLHLSVMDRLRALPGVTTVGVVNNIPLDEGTNTVRVRTPEMSGDAAPALLSLNFTGGDYFRAMAIPVLQGRPFSNDEALTPNNSVIVSRSAAAKLWPGQNAVGKSLRPRFGNQDTLSFTVVGVVGDVKQLDWRDDVQPVIYLPLTGPTARAWGMGSPAYVVKSNRAESLKREVRAIVKDVAPEAPVYREFTMEFLTRRSMIQLSFTTLTLGVVSALALILGVVGLYGVLSYVVAQRTREIGVRMALGATAAAVRRQVVMQGTRVVFVGVVIGVGAGLLSTRFLATLLYGVKPVDPLVFTLMSLTMIAMGGLASYMPARRASSVDPIVALRND